MIAGCESILVLFLDFVHYFIRLISRICLNNVNPSGNRFFFLLAHWIRKNMFFNLPSVSSFSKVGLAMPFFGWNLFF